MLQAGLSKEHRRSLGNGLAGQGVENTAAKGVSCLETKRGNESLINVLCNSSCWKMVAADLERSLLLVYCRKWGFLAASPSSCKKVVCTGVVQPSFL